MSTHVGIPAVATLAVVLAVIGCATMEQLAPPVEGLVLREAALAGIPAADLERGRAIYVTQCAQCHRPEPVDRYSEAQWKRTLPWMKGLAALSAEEAADLEKYVMVTLRALARPAAAERRLEM